MNALVLYVGTQAITYIHSKSGTPSMSTITHSSHMDIFQNLAVDLDTEGTDLICKRTALSGKREVIFFTEELFNWDWIDLLYNARGLV